MSELRKDLRAAVRSLWTEKGWDVQERLKDIARNSIEKGYEECARTVPAKDYPACLRKVAKEANLSQKYREIWGTA